MDEDDPKTPRTGTQDRNRKDRTMSENKYAAADFAAAEFAKHPDKEVVAARTDPTDSFSWAVPIRAEWLTDSGMAEEGWVPVPSSPEKPTITESEIAKAFGPEYVAWARLCLARIGITVVPDPEPTNTELLAEAITNAAHGVGIGSITANIKAIAERLDEAGVKAPGASDA